MTTEQAMSLPGALAAAMRPRRRIRAKTLFTVLPCLLLICVFVGVGIFAPALAPQDPKKVELIHKLEPPAWQSGGSWSHALGTDNLGRDVLSRLIYGTRISLLVVALTVPLSVIWGVTVGLLAAWYSGVTDKVLMRIVDVQLAMPAILFAILLAAVFGPSLRNVIILIVVWGWSGYARVIRGETLSLRERDYVVGARAAGATDFRILTRHLLPNLVNSIVILATLEIASVILVEASLSFLGVGVAPGTASWGAMVAEGRTFITIAWWLITIPGIAIFTVSLVANFMGDWLRDALDPRLKNIR